MRPQNIPSRAQPVTTSVLETFRDELLIALKVLEETIEYTKETNGEIATHNLPSGKAGLARLRSFCHALSESKMNAKLGKPLQVGETRPRYKKGKLPKTNDADSGAEEK